MTDDQWLQLALDGKGYTLGAARHSRAVVKEEYHGKKETK